MRDSSDPKGLIRESYRIEGITESECRSIFMDWALSQPDPDARPHIAALLESYGNQNPAHPMTGVLREGLGAAPQARRRGGKYGRARNGD